MNFYKRKNSQKFAPPFVAFLILVTVILFSAFAVLHSRIFDTFLIDKLKAIGLLRPAHAIIFSGDMLCDLPNVQVYSTRTARGVRKKRNENSTFRIEECQISGKNISGYLLSYDIISDLSFEKRLDVQRKILEFHILQLSKKNIKIGFPKYYPYLEILAEPIALARNKIYHPKIFQISEKHWFILFSLDSRTFALGEVIADNEFFPETDIAASAKNQTFLYLGFSWIIYLLPIVGVVSIMLFPSGSGLRSIRSSLISGGRLGTVFAVTLGSVGYFWIMLPYSTPYIFFAGAIFYVTLISFLACGIVFRIRFRSIPFKVGASLLRQKWISEFKVSDISVSKSEHEAVFIPISYSCKRCELHLPIFAPQICQKGKALADDTVDAIKRDLVLICPRCGHSDKEAIERIRGKNATKFQEYRLFLFIAFATIVPGIGLFLLNQYVIKIPYIGSLAGAIMQWVSGVFNGIAFVAVAVIIFSALTWMSRRLFSKRATRDVWACVEHGYLIDNSGREVPDEVLTCIVDCSEKHRFSLVSASELRF